MPNPGIMLGSMSAWLLAAGAGAVGSKTNTRTEEPQGCSQDPQNLSTAADVDIPCTVWPTQPVWRGWSPKTRGMSAQAGRASSDKKGQQGFRNGSVTHMAPKMQQTSCTASSYKQPPRENMGEVSIVGWAGTATVIRSLINELS